MKIKIDSDRCSGHGQCYAVAPALFEDDEAGYGQIRGEGFVSRDQEAKAEEAVRACPERAIALDRSP